MVPSGNSKTVIYENEIYFMYFIVLYDLCLCNLKTRTVEDRFHDCGTKVAALASLFKIAA